jgi:hypothetical protein
MVVKQKTEIVEARGYIGFKLARILARHWLSPIATLVANYPVEVAKEFDSPATFFIECLFCGLLLRKRPSPSRNLLGAAES